MALPSCNDKNNKLKMTSLAEDIEQFIQQSSLIDKIICKEMTKQGQCHGVLLFDVVVTCKCNASGDNDSNTFFHMIQTVCDTPQQE